MRKIQVTLGLLSLLASLFAGAATVYGMPGDLFECSIAVKIHTNQESYRFIGTGKTPAEALSAAQSLCNEATKSTNARDGSQTLNVDCSKQICDNQIL